MDGGTGFLPDNLRQAQVEMAGRIVLADEQGMMVREVRERFGFTQTELSRLLGIRRETLSRIESDRLNPSTRLIVALARMHALARGVREHLAERERAGLQPDHDYLAMIGNALRLPRPVASEIIIAAINGYESKRKQILSELVKK